MICWIRWWLRFNARADLSHRSARELKATDCMVILSLGHIRLALGLRGVLTGALSGIEQLFVDRHLS
jgi:hypothetical protein